MEGFQNLREKIGRIRFFIDKVRYMREKHLYLALFLIILILGISSFFIFIYQKKQVNMRDNMLAGYYKELTWSESGNTYKNPASEDTLTQNEDSYSSKSLSPDDEADIETQITGSSSALIKVYICGSINNPGVYEIENGARIADLLELCRGAKENAALEAVNLALILEDACMIYIPSIEEIKDKGISLYDLNSNSLVYGSIIKDSGSKSFGGSEYADIVNINSATLEELMSLPGIGQKTAESIIEYRNNFGFFKKVEELKNVKGIGDKKFEAVRDMISV